jgi:hypothetical protein
VYRNANTGVSEKEKTPHDELEYLINNILVKGASFDAQSKFEGFYSLKEGEQPLTNEIVVNEITKVIYEYMKRKEELKKDPLDVFTRGIQAYEMQTNNKYGDYGKEYAEKKVRTDACRVLTSACGYQLHEGRALLDMSLPSIQRHIKNEIGQNSINIADMSMDPRSYR